jgi:hypothetical protein
VEYVVSDEDVEGSAVADARTHGELGV